MRIARWCALVVAVLALGAMSVAQDAVKVDPKHYKKQGKWGDLTPRQISEAQQRIGREFPSNYRDAVQEYLEVAAERVKAAANGTLKRRLMGTPVYEPEDGMKLAQLPEEFLKAREDLFGPRG